RGQAAGFPRSGEMRAALGFALAIAAASAIAGEDVVNGCVAAEATDLTAAGSNVAISFTFQVTATKTQLDPARMCLKIRADQKIAMQGTGLLGGPMMVGGTVEGADNKIYDKSSPIQPSCFTGVAPNPNP